METSYRVLETENAFTRRISRIEFLKQMALVSGAVLVGCSPVKVLLKAYPGKFDTDSALVDRILRAFVVTVIPGAPVDQDDLVRIYTDEFYPFRNYCGFFAADLVQRSDDLFGTEKFEELTLEQRTAVIQNGLTADSTVHQLYTAAIFMAQVSFYGSIYNDDRGCALIDFQGTNTGFTPDEMCYNNVSPNLAREITVTGNYA